MRRNNQGDWFLTEVDRSKCLSIKQAKRIIESIQGNLQIKTVGNKYHHFSVIVPVWNKEEMEQLLPLNNDMSLTSDKSILNSSNIKSDPFGDFSMPQANLTEQSSARHQIPPL